MLDAVGRGRLHPEMRRAGHGDVSGFRHPSDGRAACAQCPDFAGAAQFQIRSRGAARSEGARLTALHSAAPLNWACPGWRRLSGAFMAASTLNGPPPELDK